MILVTGGSGFIGTHLCKALSKRGGPFRVLDLRPPAQIFPQMEFIKGDIRKLSDLERAMVGVEHVFHLAALVSVPYCQENPAESFYTNVLGGLNVLSALQKQNRKIGFTFSSSSAVYGNLGKQSNALGEDLPYLKPLSVYGEHKLQLEEAIQYLVRAASLRAVILRFFNVYGPGQVSDSPYSGVISAFQKKINEKKSLLVYGTGLQSRDFVYVGDVVDALLLTLKNPGVGDQLAVNIGSGSSLSILDLAGKLSEFYAMPSNIEFLTPREGDVFYSTADIQRAQKLLGWQPKTQLDEGLKILLGS